MASLIGHRPGPSARGRPFPTTGGRALIAALASMAVLSQTAPAQALELNAHRSSATQTAAARDRDRVWDDRKTQGAETITERDRRPYRPDGVRIGNFMLHTKLDARTTYSDNVYTSARNRVGDFSVDLRPWLQLTSNFKRHSLSITAGANLRRYKKATDLNRNDGFISVDSALHFNHAHTLSVSLLSDVTTEDRLASDAELNGLHRGRIWRNVMAAALRRDAGRLSATVGVSLESRDYQDIDGEQGSTIDQDLRDTKIFTSDLKLAYRFSPGFKLEAALSASRRLQRGNAVKSYDSWSYSAVAGVTGEVSPIFQWRLLAGYGITEYDNYHLDANARALIEAEARWLITQRATLTASLSRDFDASALSSSATRTVAKAAIQYEAYRNVIFTLDGSYRLFEYAVDDRKDEVYTGAIGFEYLHSKHVHFAGRFEHARRKSSQSNNSFDKNIVWFSTKLLF